MKERKRKNKRKCLTKRRGETRTDDRRGHRREKESRQNRSCGGRALEPRSPVPGQGGRAGGRMWCNQANQQWRAKEARGEWAGAALAD